MNVLVIFMALLLLVIIAIKKFSTTIIQKSFFFFVSKTIKNKYKSKFKSLFDGYDLLILHSIISDVIFIMVVSYWICRVLCSDI